MNRIVSPREILDLELRRLERASPTFRERLLRVERHCFWYVDPVDDPWTPPISILSSEAAVERIRNERRDCTPDTLWIFTDGSVDDIGCGAAAVCFQGSEHVARFFSERFVGKHSSTQTELVALALGCRRARELGSFSCTTIVSDSQAALMAVGRTQGASSLAVIARQELRALELCTGTLRIWWTPSHVNLPENDMADAAAKAAAVGTSFDTLRDIPLCASSLRAEIRAHYITRTEMQWDLSDEGRDLHTVMPRFTRDLQWTRGMSRKDTNLVAQFLSGHYATQAYLQRFGHPVDSSCRWCEAPLDDRAHRLFQCPRFEYLRLRLQGEISASTGDTQGWTWEFLTGRGRSYLAQFLRIVQGAKVPLNGPEEG